VYQHDWRALTGIQVRDFGIVRREGAAVGLMGHSDSFSRAAI
jgi:hypothetical protein